VPIYLNVFPFSHRYHLSIPDYLYISLFIILISRLVPIFEYFSLSPAGTISPSPITYISLFFSFFFFGMNYLYIYIYISPTPSTQYLHRLPISLSPSPIPARSPTHHLLPSKPAGHPSSLFVSLPRPMSPLSLSLSPARPGISHLSISLSLSLSLSIPLPLSLSQKSIDLTQKY
jgi:hypothetical protein